MLAKHQKRGNIYVLLVIYATYSLGLYYETAEIETCAVSLPKDNFNANFNVYSNISDAKTLENSSNQCNGMFGQI